MDLLELHIPSAFLAARTRMSWRDLQFGWVHRLVDPQAAIDQAIREVERLDQPAIALIELAAADARDPIGDLLAPLAASEPAGDDDARRDKWLYLVLAWVYEHRTSTTGALQTLDIVYAEFGYPEALRAFVRYMPMVGPDLGSRDANEARLLERWRHYLDTAAANYRPAGPDQPSS